MNNNKIYVYAFIGKVVLNIVCYSALVLLVLCVAEYCLSDNTSASSSDYITENIENELYNACGHDEYCRDVFVKV